MSKTTPRASAWLGAAALLACGASVDGPARTRSTDGSRGGPVPAGAGGSAAGASGGGAVGVPASGGGAGGSAYVDPGCPEAQRVAGPSECDLFGDDAACLPGSWCAPYVEYPNDDCAVEVFGTACVEAGTGQQGESCDAVDCAAGHACFVTRTGVRCLRLCAPDGSDGCPPGLLCGSTDLNGVNACN